MKKIVTFHLRNDMADYTTFLHFITLFKASTFTTGSQSPKRL